MEEINTPTFQAERGKGPFLKFNKVFLYSLVGLVLLVALTVGYSLWFGGKGDTNPAPKAIESPSSEQNIPGYISVAVKESGSISVPVFSSGKIAFIKDNNVWLAEVNGKARQITFDATEKISETFNHRLYYSKPRWSPDGSKFAFQQYFSGSENVPILVTDGKNISADALLESINLYWMSADKLLTAGKGEEVNETLKATATTATLSGIKWSGVNNQGDPFISGIDRPWGCGGGGRPEWKTKLSANHGGGMDGIRETFVFLPDQDSLVYSTGCEQQIVEKIHVNGEQAVMFSSEKDDRSGQEPGSARELLLSPDKTALVGTLNGNIVLYNTKGQLIKTLTNSGKAYGPVFSHDGKQIYFADNFEDKPVLKAISVEGENERVFFEAQTLGAISNISVSPNNNQLVFTLIEQTRQPNQDEGDYGGAVKESLYLMDASGKLTLFLENASQGAWSPK
ncbi:MAG: hypothetical protein G01um10145_915 [Microgenomates group bacterium Gr01-1014_5]|nr:MAG: hypothetical protein G01um10145_915 [Microgenomates group bacterium Gr01-1014_5]